MENMLNWKHQFKEWLEEIIPYGQIEKYVQFDGYVPRSKWNLDENKVRVVHTGWSEEDEAGGILKIRIFTKDHYYAIVAKENYLGCVVSKRKPRAGEFHTRGNDLPDGKFERATWEKIKSRIIDYELVKVLRTPEPKEDCVRQEDSKI